MIDEEFIYNPLIDSLTTFIFPMTVVLLKGKLQQYKMSWANLYKNVFRKERESTSCYNHPEVLQYHLHHLDLIHRYVARSRQLFPNHQGPSSDDVHLV